MKFVQTDFFKHVSVLFSGTVIAQLIGFLLLPIFTRIYSQEEFGVLTFFLSALSIGTVFTGLRFEQAIVVEENEDKAKHLLIISLVSNVILSLLLFSFVVLWKDLIYSFFNIPTSYNFIFWLPLILGIGGISESIIQFLNRQRNYKTISGNKILNATLSNGYKAAHPVLSIFSGSGLILGQCLGIFGSFVFLVQRTFKQIKPNQWFSFKNIINEYSHFPLFNAPAAFINLMAINMPVFMLSYFDGQEITGNYGNARALTFIPMNYLSASLGQVFFEKIARLNNDTGETKIFSFQLLKTLFFLGVIPSVVLVVWADSIVPFILGNDWEQAGTIVQILVLFFFALFLTSPFSHTFEVYKKLKFQFSYNLIFFIATTAAMLYGFLILESAFIALLLFAIVGIAMRLFILNYFFHLFGKNIFKETLFGLVIVVVLLALGFGIKYLFISA